MNKEVIDYYQSNIKTSRNEDSVYAIKYASQQMLINELQQENEKLKEKIDIAIEYIEENKIKSKYSPAECGFDIYIVLKENEINDLLEILKDSDVDELEHYKKLYQILKREKEELRSWLEDGFGYDKGVVAEEYIEAIENVLDKLNELEGGKNE